ncbi:MAG: hypothetical protein U0Y82_08115 [Thermoleophilia bacterium]
MRWPRLHDPHTLRRLAAPDDDLPALLPEFIARMREVVGHPGMVAADLEERVRLARAYPWERPEHPVIITGDRVDPDGPLTDGVERFPLLAFGANAAPSRLAAKLGGVTPAPLRLVPATLTGFDVVAGPILTTAGTVPAVLAASPGTEVRVAVLWATEAHLERLTLTEFGYRYGRLDGITLRCDDGTDLDSALAYLGRSGVFDLDGAPVALAAVPAHGRTFPQRTQAQLHGLCAARLHGAPDDGEALVRWLLEGPPERATEVALRLRRHALHLDPPEGFVPYPV